MPDLGSLDRRPGPATRDAALAIGPLAAGTVVGVLTNVNGQRWYRRLDKPGWTPPSWLFGPVWSVLYLLMGAASVLVARRGRAARTDSGRGAASVALRLYGLQLALNLAWSVVFFGARLLAPAAVELGALWASILATIVAFVRVCPLAGLMLVPYLAWTTFAGALNVALVARNRGGRGRG